MFCSNLGLQVEERKKIYTIQGERSITTNATTKMKEVTRKARIKDIVNQQEAELNELRQVRIDIIDL